VATDRSSSTRRAVVAAALVGLAALLVCWLVWRTRPPQMGADEEAFATVDALFTAVTARDEKRLGHCERRLGALKEAGKLPGDASDFLDDIIKTARDGRWEAAAGRLYSFMRAQRREGGQDRPTRKKDNGRPNPR
jgi:hypothetical protein